MFNDKRFNLKYTVDKRGKPVNVTSNEQLKDFYEVDSEEDDEEEKEEDGTEESAEEDEADKEPQPSTSALKKKQTPDSKVKGFIVTHVEDGMLRKEKPAEPEVKISEDVRAKLQDLNVDYARGEGLLYSDSSSEEEESSEEEDDTVYHDWGELDKDAGETDTATKRLAVCNMDWDRIRAVDLMVVLNSFVPQGIY